MQMPNDVSAESRFVWGRYVLRALGRAGHDDLVSLFEPKNLAVRTCGRELEDQATPIQEAMCDRDQIDHLMDDAARQVRQQLLARGVRQEREEPYRSIFPENLEGYTELRIDEQALRYGLLCSRLKDNLPADDVLVTSHVPGLEGLLAQWDDALERVNEAKKSELLAKGRLEAAERAWEQGVFEVYGSLVARVGKRQADRFFPRAKGSSKKKAQTTNGAGSAADGLASSNG